MKKITIISVFLGTMIEVYDFSVFAFLIPILTEVFFPSHEQQTALNFILLAYAVSYGVKPVGALVFGYFIDLYGRKKILLLTTFLMTLATTAIGLLPTHMMGAYLWSVLIACRIVQGLAISGEFSSALIMAVEQGCGRPAFYGSLAFMGGSLGLLFANLSSYALVDLLPHEQVIEYGWRIPFLISSLLWLFLLIMRNKIDDTVFSRSVKQSNLITLIMGSKRELVTTFIIASLSASAFYITFIYMPALLSTSLNLHSHQQSLLITLISLLTYLVALPFGGILADKIGTMKQIKISSYLYLLLSYVCFAMMFKLGDLGSMAVLLFFAVVQAMLNSALPAFMMAQFHPVQRGKALAISYMMSLTLFGGLMPYLILTHGSYLNPGIPISICAVLSLIVIQFNRRDDDYL
jgi:MFS transporter, MHS family, proline/betaine transporter